MPNFRIARSTSILLCLATVLALIALDYLTGAEIALTHLYLVPIVYSTWAIGTRWGVLATLLCSFGWLFVQFAHDVFSPSLVNWWNFSVQLSVFLTVTVLISLYKRQLDVEKTMARTDVLTGLANRRLFVELGRKLLAASHRDHRPFTLAYLDLDDFKTLNDQHGHDVGDDALKAVADTFRKQVRAGDLAARLGGDEFALLMPHADANAAKVAIERIRTCLDAMVKEHNWPIGFSIGVVTFVAPPEDLEHAIHAADALMYTVKRNGKNGCQYQVATS